MKNIESGELLRLAKEAYSSGYETTAVEILSVYLKVNCEDAHAWYLYGDALRIIGRAENAVSALLKAVDYADEDEIVFIYARLGMVFEKHKSRSEAEKWFKLATDRDKDNAAWIWIYRGTNLVSMGKYEAGLDCLNHAASLKSEEEDEAYLNIGYAARAMSDYGSALSAAKKALEINPGYKEAKNLYDDLVDIDSTMQKVSSCK